MNETLVSWPCQARLPGDGYLASGAEFIKTRSSGLRDHSHPGVDRDAANLLPDDLALAGVETGSNGPQRRKDLPTDESPGGGGMFLVKAVGMILNNDEGLAAVASASPSRSWLRGPQP